jgi:CRISPR-associated protein Csx14
MNDPKPAIRVAVDPTNPGQFFACCGLLELADRLWPGAEGWFEDGHFCIACAGELLALMQAIRAMEIGQIDAGNDTSSRIQIGHPFRPLRLDWWRDELGGCGKDLKVWAGTMESVRIARSMQNAIKQNEEFLTPGLLDVGVIAYDPEDSQKKVEPYYFDARRAPNAHSRDVGFSANDLSLTTTAHPVVELLCLVGLQRVLPVREGKDRIYDYHTWKTPLSVSLVPAAVCGHLSHAGLFRYRFENWFRTGQKKHKAFRSAIPMTQRGDS